MLLLEPERALKFEPQHLGGRVMNELTGIFSPLTGPTRIPLFEANFSSI
jgi:hypothetical protein